MGEQKHLPQASPSSLQGAKAPAPTTDSRRHGSQLYKGAVSCAQALSRKRGGPSAARRH